MQAHRLDESKPDRTPLSGLGGTDLSGLFGRLFGRPFGRLFGRLFGRFTGFTPSLRTAAAKGGPDGAETSTSPKLIKGRLARLQRECDVAVAPVVMLATACAVLVLVLGLNALLDDAAPALAAKPPAQLNAATQPRTVN